VDSCAVSSSALFCCSSCLFVPFPAATPPPDLYTLSLHDALPIYMSVEALLTTTATLRRVARSTTDAEGNPVRTQTTSTVRCHIEDRKSTRLNSSHVKISYAVFCLKKKKNHPLAVSDTKQHTVPGT